MYTRQQTITPEIAGTMLEKNLRNRRLNQKRVQQYATDMANGKWTESTDLIGFDEDGNLINGQHRLNAIIKANIQISTTVAYDVPKDAVMDRGLGRGTGDALYMRGLIEKNLSSRRVIAITNRYLEIARGQYISDFDRADFINENQDYILKSISISQKGVCNSVCGKAGIQAAILGALKHNVEEVKLVSFATVANTGFMESREQSAAIILRNYAIENASTGGAASNKLAAYAQMAIRDFADSVPRRSKYRNISHIYIKDE